MGEALGMIETRGLIAMIEASVLARVRDAVDVQESSIGQSRIGPERADRELAAYLDRAVEPRPDPDQTPMGTYGELHLMSVDEVATATGDSSDWRWLVPLRRLGRERQAEGRRADSLRITELAVGVMARVYGSDHIAIIHERNRLGTALTEEFGPRAGLPAFEAAAGAFDSLPGAPAGLAARALALRRLAASRQPELDPVGITTRRRLAWESVSDRAASILGALDDLDRLVERRDLQEWIAIKAELPLLLADDPYVVASASDGLSRLLFEGGLHSSAGATIVALARVAARADSPANARAAGLCVSILASARERAGRRPAWVKQILRSAAGSSTDGASWVSPQVTSSASMASIDPTAPLGWGPEWARRASRSEPERHVMTNNRTKADVLARIDEERQLWTTLVDVVGHERMEQPGPMGEWTFKDLAAHLLGWRLGTIARLEAAANGSRTQINPWPVELQDDDDINDWIYGQHHHRSVSDVLREVEQSYQDLRDAIDALSEEMVFDPLLFPRFEGRALADVEFFEHLHEEHEPSVRDWLERTTSDA
jgi:hypothetical protein